MSTRSREERGKDVALGIAHYRSLEGVLVEHYLGERIVISVRTGEFRIAPTEPELTGFSQSLPDGDFLWMPTVGDRSTES